MKKILIILTGLVLTGVIWKSCSKEELPEPALPGNSGTEKSTQASADDYIITSSLESNTLTIKIDQSAGQNVGHALLQVADCDSKYMGNLNVISSAPAIVYTTGGGTGCSFNNSQPFVKFDNLNAQFGGQDVITLTITYSALPKTAELLLKVGTQCFKYPLTLPDYCNNPPGGQTVGAYAYSGNSNATCFQTLGYNAWGWTNGPYAPGNYTFNLIASANGCNASQGTVAGKVDLIYQNGTANVKYTVLAPYALSMAHLYVGTSNLYQGAPAPSASPVNGTATTYNISNLSGSVYIIANAELRPQ